MARKKERTPRASREANVVLSHQETRKKTQGRAAPVAGESPPAAGSVKLHNRKLYPRKLYSPGEVVRASGISRQVLHNYTVLGLLQPAEVTPTNRRYYDERVLDKIKLIRRLLASGYRLRDLRETFKWDG